MSSKSPGRASTPPVRVSIHQPVMGTTLELRIGAAQEPVARAAEAAIISEAARLESALTVFDPSSEMCRWRAGDVEQPGTDLWELLALADRWQRLGRGAFNPATEVISRRWRDAVTADRVPSRDELAELAATIAAPRFAVDGTTVHRLGDLRDINLNAIAKGFVVDRIAEAAWSTFELESLTVNAGGDLLHRGARGLRVGIEDPMRPFDNAPVLTRVQLGDGGLATSGSARRWFEVGGERFNQVLDPRTGWPVDQVRSASAVAPDAATADVIATILSVTGPDDAHSFDATAPDAAWLVVAADGSIHRNAPWARIEC